MSHPCVYPAASFVLCFRGAPQVAALAEWLPSVFQITFCGGVPVTEVAPDVCSPPETAEFHVRRRRPRQGLFFFFFSRRRIQDTALHATLGRTTRIRSTPAAPTERAATPSTRVLR